ncbi:MAG: hypothetical protein ACRDQ1_03645, partial [Sciscionella sp.]
VDPVRGIEYREFFGGRLVIGDVRRAQKPRTVEFMQQKIYFRVFVEFGVMHTAAAEEARSTVFSVRLSPAVHDAVRLAAARAHLTPSALIRQWVTEHVADTGQDDLATAVAALRRDVDRLANLARPA